MDPETVDQNYAQLPQQAQQTAADVQTLASKLQAAAAAGDPNAREWMLDLDEISLGIQQEQGAGLAAATVHPLDGGQPPSRALGRTADDHRALLDALRGTSTQAEAQVSTHLQAGAAELPRLRDMLAQRKERDTTDAR